MNNPILSLTGTHGSGKTEIATRVAEKMGIPFFPSKAGEVHARYDVAPNTDVPLSLRLTIQEKILEEHRLDFDKATETGGVFDRCPLDFAAYMLTAVGRDGGDTPINNAIQIYVSACMDRMAHQSRGHNPVLFVPQFPGNKKDRGEGKAPGGAYADHHEMIILGLITKLGYTAGVETYNMGFDVTDIDARVGLASATYHEYLERSIAAVKPRGLLV